jgi:phosphohistidine swiveling domain-containing protein
MPTRDPPTFDPADAWRSPYADSPYDLWTRTNVGEVFPEVITPLTFSVFAAIGDAVFAGQPERMAMMPRELVRDGVPPAAFRAINGRMFYNTGLIHHIFTDRFGFPSWLWMLSLGGPQDPSGAHLDKKPLRPVRVVRNLPAILREGRRQRQMVAAFTRDQAQMRAQASVYRREDLTRATATALVARLGAIGRAAEAPESQLFDGSAAALNAYGFLAGLCARWCGDRALANDLVTGLGTMITANATVELWQVTRAAAGNPAARDILRHAPPAEVRRRLREAPDAAAVAEALERFFDAFGHRGIDEFELSVPRWVEDPAFVVSILRTYLDASENASPAAHLARQRRRRAEAERRARRLMEPTRLHRVLPYRRLLFRSVLRDARRLLPMRENPKHHFLLFVAELRGTILELARRLVERGILAQPDDIFFLTREELSAAAEAVERGAPAPGLPDLIDARRALFRRYQDWSPPDAIPGRDVMAVEQSVLETSKGESVPDGAVFAGRVRSPVEERASQRALAGIAASSGVATGRARVALTADEGAEIEPGEVLVAPFTDPGWTLLFMVAGAVVMDLGGLLSHGAIVAREYGIPAVVNTRTATTDIRTGQLITVNGNSGVVSWEPSED